MNIFSSIELEQNYTRASLRSNERILFALIVLNLVLQESLGLT